MFQILDKFEERLAALGEDATQKDKNATFMEVNSKNKKQRMFGMDSVASSLGSTCRISQRCTTGRLFTQEDVNAAVHDAVQSVQEELEEQKKATSDLVTKVDLSCKLLHIQMFKFSCIKLLISTSSDV